MSGPADTGTSPGEARPAFRPFRPFQLIGAAVGWAVRWVDNWQRSHRVPAVIFAVIKKFGDDQAGLLVTALGWYGFTAIYPMLLVVVSTLAYIGAASLGHGVVSTLHEFPIIGTDFTPGPGTHLQGSLPGLVVGAVGMVYGAQGVTQMVVIAFARVWNLPPAVRFDFFPRLWRSVAGLVVIGVAWMANAVLASFATSERRLLLVSAAIILGMVVLNVLLYLACFRLLTPRTVPARYFLPGSILASVFFTLLITVGTGLVERELRGQTDTYGAFASVIGVVAFLLLLARLTVYAAELNPVLVRSLWPRSIGGKRTDADRLVGALRTAETYLPPREADRPPDPATATDDRAAPTNGDSPPPTNGASPPRTDGGA